MKVKQTIRSMASKDETVASGRSIRDAAIRVIAAEVEDLCKTDTEGDTELEEWIAAGSFTGNETAKEIAEEWDSLSKE